MSGTPRTPGAPPVDWPAVFAWMETEGAGYRKAAAHFALPVDTVKARVANARKKGMAPAPVVTVQTAAAAKKATWGAPFPPAAAPRREPIPIDAFAPQVRQNLRDGVEAVGMMLARFKRAERAMAAAEEKRERMLAEGKDPALVEALCPLPPMPRMSEIDAATRSFRCMLDSVSGLAGFDAETGGVGETGGVTAEDEAAVMRSMRTPKVAPSLTLVQPLAGRGEGR